MAEPAPATAPPRYEDVAIGDALPGFETEPISRLTLALYCGASGDHNPIHVDSDFARAAGLPDVFAHGMLVMAYLAQLLTRWAPQTALRDLQVRFVAITKVHELVVCRGSVVDKIVVDGERRVRIELATTNQHGEQRIAGEATLALP